MKKVQIENIIKNNRPKRDPKRAFYFTHKTQRGWILYLTSVFFQPYKHGLSLQPNSKVRLFLLIK